MSKSTIDLSKLKTEIDNSRNERATKVAENGGRMPKDAFLYNLTESLNSGKKSKSTEILKDVTNEAAIKKNEKPPIRNVNRVQENTQRPQYNESYDKEEQMYRDMNNMNHHGGNRTLAESIQNFGGGSNINNDMYNVNGVQYLNTPPQQYQQQSQPQQINEQVLNEKVMSIVNDHIGNNLVGVLNEAINNTVANLYAADRIKTVLNENRDLIEGIVYDVIRKLQEKNKK